MEVRPSGMQQGGAGIYLFRLTKGAPQLRRPFLRQGADIKRTSKRLDKMDLCAIMNIVQVEVIA